MKIISIVGTRPQFLKLAPLSTYFKENHIEHIVINSGQHFDKEMFKDIFETLQIDEPNYNLGIHSQSHSKMTAEMMIEIEKILIEEQPKYVIVYGDCDTTLAGALVAVQLGIKLVHIEAGLRSYNKNMPEEINRVTVDHLADILCCPTPYAIENLKKENITKNVHLVGNLQIDLLRSVIDKYDNINILEKYNVTKNSFILMTIHRHYNTNKLKLTDIFLKLSELKETIIFPCHPRTKILIENEHIDVPKNIILIKPVNYLDMTILERYCKYVITDSGGVQPEVFYLKKPCITLRSETEWIDTVTIGNNIITDTIVDVKEKDYKLPLYMVSICSYEIYKLLVKN